MRSARFGVHRDYAHETMHTPTFVQRQVDIHWCVCRQVESAYSEFPSNRDLPDAVRYCVAAGMTRVRESVPDKLRRLKKHPEHVKPRDLDIWWLPLNFCVVAAEHVKTRPGLSHAEREAVLAVIHQQYKRRVAKTRRQVGCVCAGARWNVLTSLFLSLYGDTT